MTSLHILVGCETSGVVRRALAARGHDVWSCACWCGEGKCPDKCKLKPD
jgi:hypothetical protein